MNIQKNQEYIVKIIDNGFEGEGIAKIDGFTIFIPGAIKGEKVKILIVKVLSSHAFGKILEIQEKSEARQDADCATYKRCGGCNLRHIKYEETLKMKQNAVQSLVNKTLKNKIEVQSTIGMENPIHYRNKAQYPIGINKDGEPVIGVFAERTHEVIPIEKCLIQNQKSEEIAKFVLQFIKENQISIYNENKFILIKIFVNVNKNISLNEILFLNNYLSSKKLNVNWGQLWEKKIDYLEELINENGKKYPLIVNSFNYFVGMTENAISYYSSISIGDDINYVISHRSIKIGDTIESLYNPLNIILDYRVRDMAEYIKISFFKNNKLIFKEIQEYLISNNLSLVEVQLLVARLLYPSFYFDMYDDIMIDNQEEKILTFILANLDNYEIYLSNVIGLIRQRYNVDEIAWLKKNYS